RRRDAEPGGASAGLGAAEPDRRQRGHARDARRSLRPRGSGASELKGFAEPVPAWRVLSARDVESRFAATRTGSSAPLVGRQEEMGLLLRAWEGSSQGRGQVVLIQGEAGLGKSRLVEGLREAAGKDRIWVAIRCSPF